MPNRHSCVDAWRAEKKPPVSPSHWISKFGSPGVIRETSFPPNKLIIPGLFLFSRPKIFWGVLHMGGRFR